MHGTLIAFVFLLFFFIGTRSSFFVCVEAAHINYIFFQSCLFFFFLLNYCSRCFANINRQRNVMRVSEINRCQHVGCDAVVCSLFPPKNIIS